MCSPRRSCHCGSSWSCKCHPRCVLCVCRERMALQSRFAALSACCRIQALCSCLRVLETSFQDCLAAGPTVACCAACRSCLRCWLSWNLLLPPPGRVMALAMAAITWWGSSPLEGGMVRSFWIWPSGRKRRGPHVVRAGPPPLWVPTGVVIASWSDAALSLIGRTFPSPAVMCLVAR